MKMRENIMTERTAVRVFPHLAKNSIALFLICDRKFAISVCAGRRNSQHVLNLLR